MLHLFCRQIPEHKHEVLKEAEFEVRAQFKVLFHEQILDLEREIVSR